MKKHLLNLWNNHAVLSYIILVFAAFIWGTSFILIKRGLDAFDAGQVGTLRITFAFLALSPMAIKHLPGLFRKKWKIFFLVGLISNLIPALLFAKAETELPSAITGILNSLTPLFTFLIALMVFKVNLRPVQIVGLVVGFAGTLGLSFIENTGYLGSINYYVFYVIIATICYGIGVNLIKTYFNDISSIAITALSLFAVGPIAIIYLFTTDFVSRVSTHPDAVSSLFYIAILGIVGTAFALILFNKVIQMTSAVFASTVTYLIPIFAIFWGLFDGEVLVFYHFVGMALIIAGVLLVNLKRREKKVIIKA